MFPGRGLTFGLLSSLAQARWFPKTPAKSVVAMKTPIKVELVAGKTYRWCVCGRSKKQVSQPLSPSLSVKQWSLYIIFQGHSSESTGLVVLPLKTENKPQIKND